MPEGSDTENVILDMSVNGGADYSGAKVVKVTERLAIYRIYPPCGPTYGRTRMHIIGTGFKYFEQLHLKWGVLSSILLDKDTAESFVYNKEAILSNDPYENEVISMNEEVKLYYKNMKQYQTVYSLSPKLAELGPDTWPDRCYLSVGRTTEIQVRKGKNYMLHYYGPSALEYYYYQQPNLKDMKPKGGPTTGGTLLIVRGAWFKYMPRIWRYPLHKDRGQDNEV